MKVAFRILRNKAFQLVQLISSLLRNIIKCRLYFISTFVGGSFISLPLKKINNPTI